MASGMAGAATSTTPASSRSLGSPAADLPRLKLKWAFGYRGSSVYGQPTVVQGRVYVTSVSGRAYSLDAETGCVYWTYDARSPSRTAMSVALVPESDEPIGNRQQVVFFGDDTATVYALSAATGKLLWEQRLDKHPVRAHQRRARLLSRSALRARLFAGRAGGSHARISVLHLPGQRSRAEGARRQDALADVHHRQARNSHAKSQGRHAALRPCRRGGLVRTHRRWRAQSSLRRHRKFLHGRDRASRELDPRVRSRYGPHRVGESDSHRRTTTSSAATSPRAVRARWAKPVRQGQRIARSLLGRMSTSARRRSFARFRVASRC